MDAVGRLAADARRIRSALPPAAGALHAARGSRDADLRARCVGGEGELLGGTGLHRIDWALRRFEIGYWRRSGLRGRGIVTEAVVAISRMAFDALDARRVEIRMDDDNGASWKVAERAGFTLEALLRFDAATPAGEPRSTCVYARVRGAEEPIGPRRRDAGSAGRSVGDVAAGEKRSTASVMMPSMPIASRRRASAGSLTV